MEQSALKTVIITGGSSGLGLETARKIAADPAFRVVLACRNTSKAERAAAEIQSEIGNGNVLWMELDTASLDSVRRFTDAYERSGLGPVHALVCNAGISGTHTGRTADGFDIIFQTNHLGHFLLTTRMLPHMAAGGRIFAVSSDMHDPPGGKLAWPGTEALAHPDGKLTQDRNRYSYSKLCNDCMVYGQFIPIEDDSTSVYAYHRILGDARLTILCNFTEAEQYYPLPDGSKDVLIGNVTKSSYCRTNILAPWETIVLQV